MDSILIVQNKIIHILNLPIKNLNGAGGGTRTLGL